MQNRANAGNRPQAAPTTVAAGLKSPLNADTGEVGKSDDIITFDDITKKIVGLPKISVAKMATVSPTIIAKLNLAQWKSLNAYYFAALTDEQQKAMDPIVVKDLYKELIGNTAPFKLNGESRAQELQLKLACLKNANVKYALEKIPAEDPSYNYVRNNVLPTLEPRSPQHRQYASSVDKKRAYVLKALGYTPAAGEIVERVTIAMLDSFYDKPVRQQGNAPKADPLEALLTEEQKELKNTNLAAYNHLIIGLRSTERGQEILAQVRLERLARQQAEEAARQNAQAQADENLNAGPFGNRQAGNGNRDGNNQNPPPQPQENELQRRLAARQQIERDVEAQRQAALEQQRIAAEAARQQAEEAERQRIQQAAELERQRIEEAARQALLEQQRIAAEVARQVANGGIPAAPPPPPFVNNGQQAAGRSGVFNAINQGGFKLKKTQAIPKKAADEGSGNGFNLDLLNRQNNNDVKAQSSTIAQTIVQPIPVSFDDSNTIKSDQRFGKAIDDALQGFTNDHPQLTEEQLATLKQSLQSSIDGVFKSLDQVPASQVADFNEKRSAIRTKVLNKVETETSKAVEADIAANKNEQEILDAAKTRADALTQEFLVDHFIEIINQQARIEAERLANPEIVIKEKADKIALEMGKSIQLKFEADTIKKNDAVKEIIDSLIKNAKAEHPELADKQVKQLTQALGGQVDRELGIPGKQMEIKTDIINKIQK